MCGEASVENYVNCTQCPDDIGWGPRIAEDHIAIEGSDKEVEEFKKQLRTCSIYVKTFKEGEEPKLPEISWDDNGDENLSVCCPKYPQ